MSDVMEVTEKLNVFASNTHPKHTTNFIKISDTNMFSYQTYGEFQIETNFDLSIHTDD